eukprot:TRINITY_DN518_c0_g1_i2.p1 TRINITY_DN518_c0_g1~~TRINITY_DN518_c0_g1_i2.p1  ORF type:complete len:427 (+),score=179.08 TRINITY_DN518_c0_g1_i2:63-1283(+)
MEIRNNINENDELIGYSPCSTYVPIRKPKTFIINLDDPPQTRWNEVVQQHLQFIPALIADLRRQQEEELGPGIISNSIAWIFKKVLVGTGCLSEEVLNELKGIATLTESHGLDFNTLVLLNFGYDFTARCTSAVIEGPSYSNLESRKKTIYLLRNLDWESKPLRQLTIEVNFQRQGKTVFRAITFAFFIGILTGVKFPTDGNGGFSISLNYRKISDSLFGAFGRVIDSKASKVSTCIREVLETCITYEQAVDVLATKLLVAPCYLIVAGIEEGQGCIITRNPGTEENRISLLPNDSFHIGSYRYLVQTNIDHWRETPLPIAHDDELLMDANERRKAAAQSCDLLEQFAKNANFTKKTEIANWFQGCWEILLQRPVLNRHTIFSSILIADENPQNPIRTCVINTNQL